MDNQWKEFHRKELQDAEETESSKASQDSVKYPVALKREELFELRAMVAERIRLRRKCKEIDYADLPVSTKIGTFIFCFIIVITVGTMFWCGRLDI